MINWYRECKNDFVYKNTTSLLLSKTNWNFFTSTNNWLKIFFVIYQVLVRVRYDENILTFRVTLEKSFGQK